MAKKTVVTTEEIETPEAKVEEHDQAVLEALTHDDTLTLDPQTMDEKSTEEVKTEEPKVEEKVEPLDKEAIKAELKDEVTAEVKKELENQLKDQTKEEKDEYDKFVEDYTAKNGKTPEWKQVASFLEDRAVQRVKADLAAEVEAETKQEAEATKAQEVEQQQLNDKLNTSWDKQLEDLVKTGKIPAVVNADDNRVQEVKDDSGKVIEQIPQEPGKKARYELFKAMYTASQQEIDRGGEPLTNLKEIYYEHYSKDKQPAGADAPIAGVRKSVSQDSGTSFKYSDIHGKIADVLPNLLKQS